MRARLCGLLLGFLALVGVAPAAVTARAADAGLAIVGRSAIGGRGMNAALAVAGACAYVGSRDDAPVQVLDVSDPASPSVVGALPAHPGSTPRELRAVPSRRLLIVMYYRLSGGFDGFEVFHWDTDCRRLALVGRHDFGAALPHEFYLWQDPADAARVLLYTTFFASGSQQLQVLTLADPANPSVVGGWAVPAAYGHAPVHSVALSADGRVAYLALWTGGLVVADVGDFASGRPRPLVRPLTPPGGVFNTPPGNVHSATPLADGVHVLTTDERYPSPFGAGCPYGPAHVVDVSDPTHLAAVATLAVPENSPAACAAAGRGTWTSHNPTLTAHLAFVTWYSAGLQVFQLDDPARPVRLAELRPAGVIPNRRDLQLGITDSETWSYPVLSGGLVYVVDINQGLLVLRYTGPHQDEVAGAAFAEGNSNLHGAVTVLAPSNPPAPTSPTAAPGNRRPTPAPAVTRPGGSKLLALAAAVLLLAVVAASVSARHLRRR